MGLFTTPNVKNKPSRNGFDLSKKTATSAKVGELLPLMHRTVMPGDKFKMSIEHVTRTMPLETAAFTRFREYFDFFYVPYEQLYKHANQILTDSEKNPNTAASVLSNQTVGTQLPWISSDHIWKAGGLFEKLAKPLSTSVAPQYLNHAGMKAHFTTAKLLNQLGYGYTPCTYLNALTATTFPTSPVGINIPLSLLPIAAYQKIYYDFYRNQQWEANNPSAYNFDYMMSSSTKQYTIPTLTPSNLNAFLNSLFTLRYSNYPKDIIMGLLSSPQRGSIATVIDSVNVKGQPTTNPSNLATQFPAEINSEFNILQLRQAQALQRYKEIVGTGNQDYKSMVEKLYGVKLPQSLNNTATYIGGFSNSVNVQEVTNTNLASDESTGQVNAATMQGKGYGQDGNNKPIEYEVQKHGIIMCIYHVVPQLDYALNAFEFDVTKTELDDFANPVFDKIGMQEFVGYYLDCSVPYSSRSIGYAPRYYDYKTSIDSVNGVFRETLPNWLAPLTSKMVSQQSNVGSSITLMTKFFKVNPHIVDSIFYAVSGHSVDSDQFLLNANLNIHAVRNLDYDGLPY